MTASDHLKHEQVIEIIAAELHTAWRKYVDSFGEHPHGTMKQLKALLCFTTLPKRLASTRQATFNTPYWDKEAALEREDEQ